LRNAGAGQGMDAEIQALIESADFEKDGRGGDAIIEAGRRYPDEVRISLIKRLERGLPFPIHADKLLRDTGIIIDEGAIAAFPFETNVLPQLAPIAAGLLGPKTTGDLLDVLLSTQEKLKKVPPQATSDEYHALHGMISLTPPESFATAVLNRATNADLTKIEYLANLVARHGGSGDRSHLALCDASQKAMVTVVSQWAESLLADEATTRRAMAEVAQAIGRLAAPELAVPLGRLLARDSALWRIQHQVRMAELSQGGHGSSPEAYHSWTLQYARAFVAIGGAQVATIMRTHLLDAGYCGFGLEAANVLCEIWRGQQGLASEGFVWGPTEFSDVRDRRKEREGRAQLVSSPFAEDIFHAVDQMLLRSGDDEAELHALQLAAIGVCMPYGDKREVIERLLNLRQPYTAKLRLLTTLVKAGELIEANRVTNCINELIEDAKTKHWLLEENSWTIDPWLLLLPFTDRPEAILEVLALLDSRIRQPWRLGPILSALGFAPGDSPEKILQEIAQLDNRFYAEHDWFAALDKRATLSSLRILLDIVRTDSAKDKSGSPDTWTFARRLAAGMQLHPAFRADVYACLTTAISPHARAIVEYAIAEVADESGVMLLVRSYSSDGRAFDGQLGSAIEHIVIDQRPSSDWVGAFEQISVAAPSLRKRLFGMARTGEGHEAGLASACLVHIDELRDRYGIASDEARHPDIESNVPWPLV